MDDDPSEVYAWGLNLQGQLGRVPEPEKMPAVPLPEVRGDLFLESFRRMPTANAEG